MVLAKVEGITVEEPDAAQLEREVKEEIVNFPRFLGV
jgi:hypothetical protein